MKILVAGDWHSYLHEEAVYQAFRQLGHEVFRFSWHDYFKPAPGIMLFSAVSLFNYKFQNKFIAGPRVSRINADFLRTVKEHRPDIVFLYRGTHITRDTLREVRRSRPSILLLGYNNDDPFAEGHPSWLWRHFLGSIPEYDMILAYRQHNLEDFRRAGAREVRLLRSWYIPEMNHPVALSQEDRQRFECDVVFIGHYEPDGRLEYLEQIVRRGFTLRLFGTDWDGAIERSRELSRFAPVAAVRGGEYNKALNAARVALCFLSKLNRDTYTRRCFEIPASGTLLLSEYTEDLAMLYKEGVEAAFFRSSDEMLEKLDIYLRDDAGRRTVAEAGRQRVIADGHDVVSRMRQLLEWVEQGDKGLSTGACIHA